MSEYTITNANNEDAHFIDDQIIKYNHSKVPFTQAPSFIGINKVVKNKDGKVIGGILAFMYCWQCLYIEVLWVDDLYRGLNIGRKLLLEVEEEAKTKGCHMVHLDTFDFQAKDFYIKLGYQVFGVLDNCPQDHRRYFMSKVLC